MTTSARVRPVFRWAAVAASIVAIPIGLHAGWDYVEARRVTAAIAAVGQAGGSLNRAQIERSSPALDATNDAAPVYIAAASLASTSLPFGSVTLGEGKFFAGLRGPGEIDAWYSRGAIPPELLEQTRTVLDQQADTLRLLDVATARPFNGFARGTSYAAQIMQFDQLSRLCNMRTVHAAATGNRELAIRSLLAELRLFGDPNHPVVRTPIPKLLLSTISLSLLLNVATPTAADLNSLSNAFERADDDRMLERELDESRAGYISAFLDRARYFARPIGLSGLVPGLPGNAGPMLRPLLARELRRRLEADADLIAASRLQWPDRLDTLRTVAIKRQWRDDAGFLVDHGWSLDPWGLTAVPLSLTSVRVARTAIAVERYRLAHHGQLPDTLAEIAPAFLSAIPIDPYSGHPIEFRRVEGGYEVYGVSLDRLDDGGDLVKDLPVVRVRR